MKNLTLLILTFLVSQAFAQESAIYQRDSIYKVNQVKARLWYSGTDKDKELTKTTYYNRAGKLIKYQLEPNEEGTQVSTYYLYDSSGRFINMVDTIRHENKTPVIEVAQYEVIHDGDMLVKMTRFHPDGSVDYIIRFSNNGKTEILYRYKKGIQVESYTTEHLNEHNEERFYGWEKVGNGNRKSTWDYRYKYEFENSRVKSYIRYDGKKKMETAKLSYSDKGLLIKIDKYTPEFFEYVYYWESISALETNEPKSLNIKDWAAEDRPREKLLQKGTGALSDAELIAILIGSGTRKMTAVELSKLMLQQSDNNLNELARLSVKDLMKMKGIGEAKAITIIAALELGRRRKEHEPSEKPKITSSQAAYELLKGDLMDLRHEEFWVLLLNRANKVIKKKRVSEGGVSGTVADPKIIFKLALEEMASGVIVAHNHPSGNLTPSQSDIDLTKKLKEAGKVMEIQLLDHVIVAGNKYMSFTDEGMI